MNDSTQQDSPSSPQDAQQPEPLARLHPESVAAGDSQQRPLEGGTPYGQESHEDVAARHQLVASAPAAPAEPEQPKREAADLSAVLESIPAKKWFTIRKRLGMTMDEVTDDSLAVLVVVAEHLNPKMGWDHYLSMTITQLADELGLDAQDPKATAGE